MASRLEKNRSDLLQNKKKDEVDKLFEEPFCGVHSIGPTDDSLSKEQAKVKELSAKLQTLSVRNVNKQIKRRDLKLAEVQTHVKEIEEERRAQDKNIQKLKTQLHSARTSVHSLRQKLYRSRRKDELIDLASQENLELHSELDDVEETFSPKIAELEKN